MNFILQKRHMPIKIGSHNSLVVKEDGHVKYADILSDNNGITVVFLNNAIDSRGCSPFIISQNKKCFYQIKGVTDDVPGVS